MNMTRRKAAPEEGETCKIFYCGWGVSKGPVEKKFLVKFFLSGLAKGGKRTRGKRDTKRRTSARENGRLWGGRAEDPPAKETGFGIKRPRREEQETS